MEARKLKAVDVHVHAEMSRWNGPYPTFVSEMESIPFRGTLLLVRRCVREQHRVDFDLR